MERPNSGEEGEGDSPNETRISLETAAAEADDSVPYIGQRFLTHEAAYELYSGFAKQCGFSIRRHRTEGKDGVGKGLTRRYFVCHRAGNTPAKPFDDGAKQQRNRKSSAAGARRTYALGMRELVQMMRIMELEKCVQPGTLPFTEKDVRNLIQSFRRFEHQEESVDLLQMCRNVKEKDPNFSCALLRKKICNPSHGHYRKAPQTILTDQNKYLKEAVQKELPNTKHAFSIGLLASRFPSWFSAVLGGHYNDWEVEFYRLYNMESTMDFDLGWSDMVAIVVDYKDQAGEQQIAQQSLETQFSRQQLQWKDMLLLFSPHTRSIPDHYVPVRWRRTQAQPSKSLISAPHYGRSYERVKELQSMVAVLVSEASQSEERMDLATQEVSVLLSRIKQQPVVANVSGDSVRRLW
ncbi:hypothetical protein ZWY2020_037825 [Hordeum vulgare]|nr:hypothetical protein ZWY2020_037825 [Hordeum vulgare]